MRVYLDASVIVPLLRPEPAMPRVTAMLRGAETVMVSDFAVAETAAAVSRLVGEESLSIEMARSRLEDFGAWRVTSTVKVSTCSDDIRDATQFVLRFDLMLRAPDALHLALACRASAALATLDVRLVRAARALGLSLAPVSA